jgi:hypothetical protein
MDSALIGKTAGSMIKEFLEDYSMKDTALIIESMTSQIKLALEEDMKAQTADLQEKAEIKSRM